MRFAAFNSDGTELANQTLYSIGGGFVVNDQELQAPLNTENDAVYRFTSGAELLETCAATGKSIAEVMWANELSWRSETEVRDALLEIWKVMQQCVENGCRRTEKTLPGGLNVTRRAPALRERLRRQEAEAKASESMDPLWAMEWVNLYALAVNEENASGGRIVTAPTNGAAGIIPAVVHYYTRFVTGASDEKVIQFLLTAAAIGIIIKTNASISGAEVGCQAKSARRARWQPRDCAPCLAAPPNRWRTPRRWRWSTTWG